MRKLFILFLIIGLSKVGNSQNVGIGTTTPATKLHIKEGGIGSQLWLEDTIAASRIKISAYSDVGLQFPYIGTHTNHNFALVTRNLPRLFVDTLGKVGIGILNPITRLSNTDKNIIGSNYWGISAASLSWVVSDVGYTQALFNGHDSSGAHGLLVKIRGTSYANRILDLSTGNFPETVGKTVMVVTGNGNVGIGTGYPFSRFSNVSHGIRGSNGVGIFSNALAWSIRDVGYTQALFNANPNNDANGLAVKIAGKTNQNKILELSVGNFQDTAGTAVMVVNGDGKVGIGTGNPVSKLSIFGGGFDNCIIIGDTSGVYTTFSGASVPSTGLIPHIGTNTFHPFSIMSANQFRMHFATNGNIGIGTNNPEALLSLGTRYPHHRLLSFHDSYSLNNAYGVGIEGNPSSAGSRLMIYCSKANSTDAVALGSYSNTSFTEAMRVEANGRVGIGTVNPVSRFSNTNRGIRGSSGISISGNAMAWSINDAGYTQALFNSNPAGDANGLAVKIAGNTSQNKILELSVGNFQDTAGTSVMLVQGDGKMGVGISNPQTSLHIGSDNAVTGGITIGSGTSIDGGNLRFLDNSPTHWNIDNWQGALRFFTETGYGTGGSLKAAFSPNGYLGIGTVAPQFPLHVANLVGRNVVNYGWLNGSGNVGFNAAPAVQNYSIKSEGRIAASEFNAFSDSRIKSIQGLSNMKNDLSVINQLEITDYSFIDKVGKGNAAVKGMIAQQVESVYPQAVHKIHDFVPDIYCMSDSTHYSKETKLLSINICKPHHLKAGDKVRIITEEGVREEIVSYVGNETQFTLANMPMHIGGLNIYARIFVFGKEVDDFRSIDYNQVFSLGISAIQQLSKEIEEQKKINESLQEQIIEIKEMMISKRSKGR